MGVIQEAGPWSGKRMASGTAAVTGELEVDTGLALVETFVAAIKSPTTDDDFMHVTMDFAGTDEKATIYVWKATNGTTTTKIASIAEVDVDWIAVGT